MGLHICDWLLNVWVLARPKRAPRSLLCDGHKPIRPRHVVGENVIQVLARRGSSWFAIYSRRHPAQGDHGVVSARDTTSY
jgi:hypothetical protein